MLQKMVSLNFWLMHPTAVAPHTRTSSPRGGTGHLPLEGLPGDIRNDWVEPQETGG